MNLTLAKELYFWELEERTRQDQRFGTSLVLLSLVGGVIYFLIRRLPPDAFSLQTIATALAAVCYVVTAVYVGRATVGHPYEVLPDADALLKYYKGVAEYYRVSGDAAGTTDGDFDDFLLRHLVAAATRTRYGTLRRTAHYYVAHRFALWAIAFAALAGVALAWPYIATIIKEGVR